jgi:vacuolar-type H+-ATPase subunit I/STV1|tara:strand:+ start:386 stop:919 length:534 start_codon:yes stop_codon:yes gene_type:complete
MEQDQSTVEQKAQAPVAEKQQEVTDNESPDVGSLIAESKKYRSRAQESESRVKNLEDQLKAIEDQQLAEKEDYKTLAEKREEELKVLRVKAERSDALEEALRAEALESVPEEYLEYAEEMSTDKLLKFVTQVSKKEVPTNETAAATYANPVKSPFGDMTSEERRKNWTAVVQSYMNK